MRPVATLSRRQRRGTPPAFAIYLAGRVLALHPSSRLAVLRVQHNSVYDRLWPAVEMWGEFRDARKYKGPWPVICHPPCGPWGKYSAVSKESKEDGVAAMELVHRFGGVVEHPLGSQLFKLHGDGRPVERVNQGAFGHLAQKATLLYFV